MTNIATKVENLSKRYRIGREEEKHDTLCRIREDGIEYDVGGWES